MATPRDHPTTPPLNALRAFEAAARLGGFAAAADELCVTPGAVSQHIKSLEAWAGAPLFERRSQGVALTPLGQHVVNDFRTAFDRLGDAVHALRATAAPKTVHIATLPSIAQLWLLPRLPRVRQSVPDAVISVTTLQHRPNFRRQPFDLSLFYEDGPAPDNAVRICEEVLFPVCVPAVAARLKDPADLASENFLHDATWAGDWDQWLAASAPNLSLDTSGSVFSLFSLALEEAKNGAGVLIAHEPLVDAQLSSGELVAPFPFKLRSARHLTVGFAASDGSNRTARSVVDSIIDNHMPGLA